MNYSEKLKDPRWQKKRLEIFKHDDFMCCFCGDNESTLSIHHLIYEENKEPWESPDENLITLCENCHQAEFEVRKDIEVQLLKTLKFKRYKWDDLVDINAGFRDLKMHVPEVNASIIKWIFQNKELCQELVNRYFDYLSKKQKEK